MAADIPSIPAAGEPDVNRGEDSRLSSILVATLLFVQLFIVSFVLELTGHETAANACMAAGLSLYTLVQINAIRHADDDRERWLYTLSAVFLGIAALISIVMAFTSQNNLASSFVTGLIFGGVAAQTSALFHRRKMRR